MLRELLGRVKRKTLEYLRVTRRLNGIRKRKSIRIMNSADTIRYLLERETSVARYGDGEFNLVFNQQGINFQKGSEELSQRLGDILKASDTDMLICIPYAINSVKGMNEHARNFYNSWALGNYERLSDLLAGGRGPGYAYGDTSMTRPYKDWEDITHAEAVFDLLRQLWDGRDILCVEGCKTRMGVGNDLFANARSIKRILAPAENAFDCYTQILDTVCSLHQDELIILALGPTATVLAWDLHHLGKRALDVGHMDIEYEWFRRNAQTKVAIPGKYTNEATLGNQVTDCDDPTYLSQIIARVGC